MATGGTPWQPPDQPPVSTNRITKVELAYAVFAYADAISTVYTTGTQATISPTAEIGKWFYYTSGLAYKQLPGLGGVPTDIKWIDTFGGDTSTLTVKTSHFLSSYIDDTLSFTSGWADPEAGYVVNDSSMPQRVKVWMRVTYLVESVTNTYITSPREVVLNAMKPFVFGTFTYGGTRETVATTSTITGITLNQMDTVVYVWGDAETLDIADFAVSAGNTAPAGRASAYGIVYLDGEGNTVNSYKFPGPQISIGNLAVLPNDATPTPAYITSTHNHRHLLPSYWTPLLFHVEGQTLSLFTGNAADTIARVDLYEYSEYPLLQSIPIDDTAHPLVYTITDLEGSLLRNTVLMFGGERTFNIPVEIQCPSDNELTTVSYDVELIGAATEVYWQDTATKVWTAAACTNEGDLSVIPSTPTVIADIDTEGTHRLSLAVDVDKIIAVLPEAASGKPIAIKVAVSVSGTDITAAANSPIDAVEMVLYLNMAAGSFTIADATNTVYGSSLTQLYFSLTLGYPASSYAFTLADFDYGFNNANVRLNIGGTVKNTNVSVMQNDGLAIIYELSQTITIPDGTTSVKGTYRSDLNGTATALVTIDSVITNDLSLLSIDQKSLFNLDNITTSIAAVKDVSE